AEELFVEQSARAIAQGCYDQALPEPLGSPTSTRGRDGAAQQGLDLSLGSAAGQGGKRGSIHKTRLMTLTQLNPRDVAGYLGHGSFRVCRACCVFCVACGCVLNNCS